MYPIFIKKSLIFFPLRKGKCLETEWRDDGIVTNICMKIKVVKTRDGDLVPFDISRIERAVEKAAESAGKNDFSFIDDLTADIQSQLSELAMVEDGQRALTIEEIQDVVENKLMENHLFDIAKQYIIYRNERRMKRAASKKNSLK